MNSNKMYSERGKRKREDYKSRLRLLVAFVVVFVVAITMEEDRLWKFTRPEWLNSAWARSAGVYGAGALVRFCLLACLLAFYFISPYIYMSMMYISIYLLSISRSPTPVLSMSHTTLIHTTKRRTRKLTLDT